MASPIRKTPNFSNGDNFQATVKAETSKGVEVEKPMTDVEF